MVQQYAAEGGKSGGRAMKNHDYAYDTVIEDSCFIAFLVVV